MPLDLEKLPEPTQVVAFRPDDRVLITFERISHEQAVEIKRGLEAIFPDIKFAVMNTPTTVTVLRKELIDAAGSDAQRVHRDALDQLRKL